LTPISRTPLTDPFPAAADDAWEAFLWVVDHAPAAFGVAHYLIGAIGLGFGGNLAAVTSVSVLEAFAMPMAPRIMIQFLGYPVLDHTASEESMREFVGLDDPEFNREVEYEFRRRQLYLPDEENREERFASPMLWDGADWETYPRTKIMTNEDSPLRPEADRFMDRLCRKGVNVDQDTWRTRTLDTPEDDDRATDPPMINELSFDMIVYAFRERFYYDHFQRAPSESSASTTTMVEDGTEDGPPAGCVPANNCSMCQNRK
jgi:acetyl esterase/lipase